jgi:hypothetical protein
MKGGFYNIMEFWVYISHLKDEKFDYDIENPNGNDQYAPKPIGGGYRIDGLYWGIVHRVLDHNKNTKQTDWGTFVEKLTNIDLIQLLSEYVSSYEKIHKNFNEKFNNGQYKYPEWAKTNFLLEFAKELPDGEYLLVGQELF